MRKPYTIGLDEVADELYDAISGGYTAYVVINGEFYDIEITDEYRKCKEQEENSKWREQNSDRGSDSSS